MADLTTDDIRILMSLLVMVIFMSLILPGVGLSDTSFDLEEAPSINVSDINIDIRDDIPQYRPETSTEGYIGETDVNVDSENDKFIWRDEAGYFSDASGTKLIVFHDPPSEKTSVELGYYDADGLAEEEDAYWNWSDLEEGETADEVGGETQELEIQTDNGEDIVIVDIVEFKEGAVDEGGKSVVEYDVQNAATPDSFLGGIPVIGGAADAVGSAVAWIANVIMWFPLFVFSIITAIASVLWNISSFFFDLVVWISEGFTKMIVDAPGPASIIALVITILFSVYLTKLGAWAISYIPSVK